MGRTALSVYRHHPNPTDVDVPTPVCVHLVELGVGGGDTRMLVDGAGVLVSLGWVGLWN